MFWTFLLCTGQTIFIDIILICSELSHFKTHFDVDVEYSLNLSFTLIAYQNRTDSQTNRHNNYAFHVVQKFHFPSFVRLFGMIEGNARIHIQTFSGGFPKVKIVCEILRCGKFFFVQLLKYMRLDVYVVGQCEMRWTLGCGVKNSERCQKYKTVFGLEWLLVWENKRIS